MRNRHWLNEKLYRVLRRHGVALALVDHAWMPRPAELFKTGDPVTANFALVRWIGDRKGIEEQTKVWDRTLVNRTEDLREWVKVLGKVSRQVDIMFAYANNHYGGHAPDTIELFRSLWPQQQITLPKHPRPNPCVGPPRQQVLGFARHAKPEEQD